MLPDNPQSIEFKMTLPSETSCLINRVNNSTVLNYPLTNAAMAATTASETSRSTIHISSFSFDSNQLEIQIMPGIHLTKNGLVWSDQRLRSHGFTHIITIDKHIQELYYPSLDPAVNISPDNHRLYDQEFSQHLRFDDEFETLDLNFGEKAYLTTVLPNCYKSVKFIDRALSGDGTILVIDCNGGEQKCLTIIVAYLMYKNNYSFSNAFSRLRLFYKRADLDKFYVSQLYEYEPILQVHRAQSRGHSCSRELHSAILKRKKLHDDHNEFFHSIPSSLCSNSANEDMTMD